MLLAQIGFFTSVGIIAAVAVVGYFGYTLWQRHKK